MNKKNFSLNHPIAPLKHKEQDVEEEDLEMFSLERQVEIVQKPFQIGDVVHGESEQEQDREKDQEEFKDLEEDFDGYSGRNSKKKIIHVDELSMKNKEYDSENQLDKKQKEIMKEAQILKKRGEKKVSTIKKNTFKFKERSRTQKPQQNRSAGQIWKKSSFFIIAIINQFIMRLKETTINFKPEKLTKFQHDLINDKSAKHAEDWSGNLHIRYQGEYEKKSTFYKKLPCFKTLNRCLKAIQNQREIQYLNKLFSAICERIPVFYSQNYFHVTWDSVIHLAALYLLIVIPMKISFSLNEEILLNFEKNILPALFITNSLISLNTSYFQSGILIKDRSQILINYFKYQFFSQTIITLTIIYDYYQENILIAMVCYFFIIIKSFQPQESYEYITNKFKISTKMTSLQDLFLLLIKIIYFNHIFGSAIHWIAQVQQQEGQHNWLREFHFSQQDILTRYLTSFYFGTITMCTVGFGDLVPVTLQEKCVLIILTLLSTAIFGYTLNSIGYIFIELGKREQQHQSEIFQLNQYMNEHNVDPFLQNQARKYAQFLHNEELDNQDKQGSCLQILSINMRENILQNIFYQRLANITFLKNNFSQIFLENLAVKVREKLLGPGDVLIKNGENIQPCIFMVDQGKLDITFLKNSQDNSLKSKIFLQYIQKNQYFGQYEFFRNEQQSVFTVSSIGITTIFYLTLNDFKEVLSQSSIYDQEAYQFIQDSLIFGKSMEIIKMNCFSCQSSEHLAPNCPFLVYGGDKQQMINQIQKEDAQFRTHFRRIKKKTRNPRSFLQTHMILGLKWKKINQQYANVYNEIYYIDDDDAAIQIDYQEEDIIMMKMGYQYEETEQEFTNNQYESESSSPSDYFEETIVENKDDSPLQRSIDSPLQSSNNSLSINDSTPTSIINNNNNNENQIIKQKTRFKEGDNDNQNTINSDGMLAPQIMKKNVPLNGNNNRQVEIVEQNFQKQKSGNEEEKEIFQGSSRNSEDITPQSQSSAGQADFRTNEQRKKSFIDIHRKIIQKSDLDFIKENQKQYNNNNLHSAKKPNNSELESKTQDGEQILHTESNSNFNQINNNIAKILNIISQIQQQNRGSITKRSSIMGKNPIIAVRQPSLEKQLNLAPFDQEIKENNEQEHKKNYQIYSTNDDIDKMKSFSIYFPTRNIEQIFQIDDESSSLSQSDQNNFYQTFIRQQIVKHHSHKNIPNQSCSIQLEEEQSDKQIIKQVNELQVSFKSDKIIQK